VLRSLRSRLVAAFVVLAIAVLLGVSGALFLVLRELHQDSTVASLEDVAGSVLPQVRDAIGTGNLRGTVAQVRDELASHDIGVMLVGPDGRLRPLTGAPDGPVIQATDLSIGETAHGGVSLEGRSYLYVATGLRRAAAAAPRAIAFLQVDRSGALALADLGRTIPAVTLVVLLVAAPLAWVVARSVSGPLRQISLAAASLPGSVPAPVGVEGPVEVRELATSFNAMTAELGATRARESALLANLRHDLRTPVTVIAGFAAALRDGTASGEAAVSAARAIEEEAARLERLVDSLGQAEGRADEAPQLHLEPVDLQAVVATAVARFADRAERADVVLSAAAPGRALQPAETTVAADDQAVDRMLGNLVGNALAVVGRGGHVRIEVTEATLRDQPAVAVDVVDDGPGFPPGGTERAFDRFWRGDPSRSGGGSGLGLAIVRELATEMGGTVHAANLAPNGGRVGFVLPRLRA